MKSLIIILFFVGIILTIIGYYQGKNNCPINKIKYKFIPKTIEEDQAYPQSVYKMYQKMFSQPSLLQQKRNYIIWKIELKK